VTSPAQDRASGPFINRGFTLLFVGQAISFLGDMVFMTTLTVWIAAVLAQGLPIAPLAVSGVTVATSVPTLLLAPLAGVFVDRWDKRRTMLVMDAARGLLVAALLPATGLVPLPFLSAGRPPLATQLAAVYIVVLLTRVCAQFFSPARLALTADLVEEAQRAQASSLEQTTSSLAVIVGPPLAAPLLFAFGPEWALLLEALSYAVSFITIRAIRVPETPRITSNTGSVWRELLEGVGFATGNRLVTTLFVAIGVATLGIGALNALDVFFVTQNLHAPAIEYGFIAGGLGLGSLAGAFLAAAVSRRVGLTRMFAWSIVLVGILIVIQARLTNFVAAVAISVLIGLPVAAVNVAFMPLLLAAVPRALVGRVSALLSPFMTLAAVLGAAIAGYLAGTVMHNFHAVVLGISIGPVDTIFTAAGLFVLAGGLYAVVNLRNMPTAGS
jgi:MFS family permease